jgi:hypothetical protein
VCPLSIPAVRSTRRSLPLQPQARSRLA